MAYEELIRQALLARQKAYVPYSGFSVGAALLAEDGEVYTGCNVENASYGLTVCAERAAIFHAVSCGVTRFRRIAIAGGKQGQAPDVYAYPCGACRQVMAEFVSKQFEIVVAKDEKDYQIFSMEEMLPWGFGGEAIK